MYKTRPVTFSLPQSSNFESNSISNFKGLQLSDNPILADSESASDILNVYLNDSGVLTTRPRIDFDVDLVSAYRLVSLTTDSELLSRHKLESCILYRVKTNDVVYLFKKTEYFFIQIDTSDFTITDGKFDCFEKNEVIYLINDSNYLIIRNNICYDVFNDSTTYIPTISVEDYIDGQKISVPTGEVENLLSEYYKKQYFWNFESLDVPENADSYNGYILTDLVEPLSNYSLFVAFNDGDRIYIKSDRTDYKYYDRATKTFLDTNISSLESRIQDWTISFDKEYKCLIKSGSGNTKYIYKYLNNGQFSTIGISITSSLGNGLYFKNENTVATIGYNSNSNLTLFNLYTIEWENNAVGSQPLTLDLRTVPGVTNNDSGLQNTQAYYTTTETDVLFSGNLIYLLARTDNGGLYDPSGDNLSMHSALFRITIDTTLSGELFSCPEPERIDSSHINLLLFAKMLGFSDTFPVLMFSNNSTIYSGVKRTTYYIEPTKNTFSTGTQLDFGIFKQCKNNAFVYITSSVVFDEVFYNRDFIFYFLDTIIRPTNKIILSSVSVSSFSDSSTILKAKGSLSDDFIFADIGNPETPTLVDQYYLKYSESITPDFYVTYKSTKPRQTINIDSFYRFQNNYWFYGNNNKMLWTELNDPTYIPIYNFNETGNSERITGCNNLSDETLLVCKQNKLYIVSAITVGNERRYSFTETKGEIGNIPIGQTIITAYGDFPIQIDDSGIYTIKQLTNVTLSEHTTQSLSLLIDGKFLKEENKNKIITHNHRYWTYIFIPEETKTKVYILDGRSYEWYYWELPEVQIVSVWDEQEMVNDKLYITTKFATAGCKEYSLRVSDKIVQTDALNSSEYYSYYEDFYGDEYKPIKWLWKSQILPLSYTAYSKARPALNYQKQLVQTGFMFVDSDEADEYSLKYNFKVYRKNLSEINGSEVSGSLNRIRSVNKRTYIPKFNFLQITLENKDSENYYETNLTNRNNKLNLIQLKFKYKLREDTL